MSYEHKSNIQEGFLRKHISSVIKVVISIVIVLFLFYFFAPAFLPSFFTTIFSPLWRISKNLNHEQPTIPPGINNPTILELQMENNQLKELLGRTNSISDEKHFILSYVLKKPPFSAYDIFIIDIGSLNDVKKGDKVYALGNILIGEVEEVSKSTSKVKLYSSYGEKFEVTIGEKAIRAEALGKGGGSFELSLPRDMVVREGDIVTVPQMNDPVFGVIQKVIIDPAHAFSTILFSQPINIYEERWVIVKKSI